MAFGGERNTVQAPFLGYAQEVGWDYLTPDKALNLRGGRTGLLLRETFLSQMERLNPGIMTREKGEELVRRIERIPPNIEGNFIAWEFLKGLRTVFVEAENRERNLTFLDTEDIPSNTFHITDEFAFTNGSRTIRADIVLLINGIPVFFVETKAAYKIDGIAEALDQIRRYHRDCPELLAILQIYALTHLLRYYYSGTWNMSRKTLFNWREETDGDFETLVKTFCDRERMIRFLTDYILFTRQDDELKKIILRPHQMRAVGKLVERASDPDKKRGLVWHTQGSGKTYTMIVTAQQILKNPVFENPTVIMLVDRNELESQLYGNLKAVGIRQVEIVTSKRHLRELLQGDRRGLIVTMIHKFDGMPADVNKRENIIVLVDEAHRTTGGKLGNYLTGALPEATYIGFTGTPIDRTVYGKGTFITFGKNDPPKGYLDKYGIGESIADGTTVPLHYALAPNELRVDRATLEKEFLDLATAEGMSDIAELNKVLERAVNLRNMMKNPERMTKIAHYIADHYRDNIEPLGYKAFLVAVDREACALYKKELDKVLPADYTAVVYSRAQNDPGDLTLYYLSDDEEKRVRVDFRNAEKIPKILIVTEKLLTGFDAPILYCMYLDKPMRDHVLLQAIARVNRPYEDSQGKTKPSGFVLDFVGIFENLEKALAFDSSDIEGVVKDLGILKGLFVTLIAEGQEKYLSIAKGKKRDKAIEALLTHFLDEEARHEFYQYFKTISEIYDILSPDSFLRPYVEDMEELARLYKILKDNFEPGISVDREFSRKTAKLVQKHSDSTDIGETSGIYEIDEKLIWHLEESEASDIEKVFNLIKSIQRTVEKYAGSSPVLVSIGEKAERIVQAYKDRQKSTQETLEELKKIVEEINEARAEQEKMNMTVDTFAIFWIMKKERIENPEGKAREMKTVLDSSPHWRESEKQEREVRSSLYRIVLASGKPNVQEAKETVTTIIKVLRQAAE